MSIEEICIYILPVVYLLIILAHLFKFKKDKVWYNNWLFVLMFIAPVLIYWVMVNGAYSTMIDNSTILGIRVLSWAATIIPFLYIIIWLKMRPKNNDVKHRDKEADQDKKEDYREFFAIPIAFLFLFVSAVSIMSDESKVNVYIMDKIESQGWIYYISTVDNVTRTSASKYTISYISDIGYRDYFKLGFSKSSTGPYLCPFKVGDKALWRRGYGMRGASFKVMDFRDANKPELAEKIEQYNTPILVIDHKEIPYNSVSNPSEYGINILYKAIAEKADSGKLCLRFKDIHNMEKSVMYNAPNQRFMPDTFLLFNNEVSAPNFVVCAQQINTRENWAKVSDYGYIFGYDVYSKDEIEERFEEVRKYVDNLREAVK